MAGRVSSVVTSAVAQSSNHVREVSKDAAITTSDSLATSPKMDTYFSQSQMALALTIAKSKPEGVSINDYCQQLWKRITKHSPDLQIKNLRYIDTCEFWKDQYTRVHQQKKELENELQLLKEKQRGSERSISPDSDYQSRFGSTRKRHGVIESVEGWLGSREEDPPLLANDDHLRLSSWVLQIARKRRDLEKTTKGSNLTDHIDALVRSASELLGFLEHVLSDCSIPLWKLECNDESEISRLFQQVMHQISLSYSSSFEALDELVRTIPGRKKRSELVYRLVIFFNHALDHLHMVSTLQAENEIKENQTRRNKRARTDPGEYVVNKYLARTIITMTQIDWKAGHVGHIEVLEGIIFSILDHTGRLLSRTVFEEHVAGSHRPGNISMDRPVTSAEATKFEFRYIVPILNATLGGPTRKDLVARVLGDNIGNVNLQSRLGSSSTCGQIGNLSLKVKKALQKTLIKSALGADAEGLKLPTLPEEVEINYIPKVDVRVEQFGPQWFLESVWALVGWELAI